ncbi:MAG: amino acid permease [Thermoplasmatales archaeon]
MSDSSKDAVVEAEVEREGILVRKWTLHDAVLFGIGAAIGSGILFAAAGGSAYVGPGVTISWILATILIAIIVIPYAEFGGMAPRSGISARISYYAYGNYGGFMAGWGLLIWTIMIPPIEAIAVSGTSEIATITAQPTTNYLSYIIVVIIAIAIIAAAIVVVRRRKK